MSRDSTWRVNNNTMSDIGEGSSANRPTSANKRKHKMKVFGKKFTTVTYLSFVVVQFLLYACKADAGVIFVPPKTQKLLLNTNENATFFCQASGINVYWLINDATVEGTGNADLKLIGWIFNETIDYDTAGERNNIHNLTLQIPSIIANNNTKVRCAAVIHNPELSDPAYLLIKAVYLSIEREIIFTPPQVRVPRSENTTFYCNAVGDITYWSIKGETVDDDGTEKWKDRGYTFHRNVSHDLTGNGQNIHRNSLVVPTSLDQSNNTIILCIVAFFSTNTQEHSDSVAIIVMGAPSVPIPVPRFDSPQTVTLEWDAPYSWDEYPVQHYDVEVTNHSELDRQAINETSVQYSAAENHQECKEIVFKVRASNSLGNSDYGSVIAGFPIEPELTDNSMDIVVSWSASGNPQVSIKVTLPRVCSYQTTNYTIIMAEVGASNSKEQSYNKTRGPFNGTVTSDSFVLTDGVNVGKSYKVTVEFFSEVDHQRLVVVKDTYISEPETPTFSGLGNSSALDQQYVIIGAVAGGLIIIIILMVIIIMVVVALRRRQNQQSWSPSNSNEKRPHPMVTNPIYDAGPVYETIPPNAPLRMHSNSESSNVTGTSSLPPTPTTPLPPAPITMESPYAYAPNQIDPAYAQPHQLHRTNFSFDETSYMVMNAVQEGKRLSEDEETNLDSDSTRARYVPEPCSSMV